MSGVVVVDWRSRERAAGGEWRTARTDPGVLAVVRAAVADPAWDRSISDVWYVCGGLAVERTGRREWCWHPAASAASGDGGFTACGRPGVLAVVRAADTESAAVGSMSDVCLVLVLRETGRMLSAVDGGAYLPLKH